MDLTKAQLVAGINNTDVQAAVNSLATTVSVSTFIFEILDGTRNAQQTYNTDAGTGPYLSIVDPPFESDTLLLDTGSGEQYLTTQYTAKFRKVVNVDEIKPVSTTVII